MSERCVDCSQDPNSKIQIPKGLNSAECTVVNAWNLGLEIWDLGLRIWFRWLSGLEFTNAGIYPVFSINTSATSVRETKKGEVGK